METHAPGGEKILLFGGLPHAYLDTWDITSDLELAEAKLNVQFETIPHDEVVARYENASSADRARVAALIAELISGAQRRRGTHMPPLVEIEKSVRLYTVLDGLRTSRSGDAVAVVCAPWIRGDETPVPCIALMLLQEQGVPAACQTDIDALLTMVLYHRVDAHPSFMGGARRLGNHVAFSHCALARTIARDIPQPYTIMDYHGRKPSPTVWTAVPAGETVTIARLTENLTTLLLAQGTVRGKGERGGSCTNTLLVDVKHRNRLLNAVKGHQNHYVIAWGDHAEAVAGEARTHGIRTHYL